MSDFTHLILATAEDLTKPWRVGRRNPYTFYAQLTDKPSDDDHFIGSLHEPSLVQAIVMEHNNSLRRFHGE
jgi:hypothetical protein